MRKAFANLLLEETKTNPNIVVLTGDLGYKMWDEYKEQFPCSFYNLGSAEQLMVGAAIHYRDWETDRKSTRLNSSH